MIDGFADNDKDWLELSTEFDTPANGLIVVNTDDGVDHETFGKFLVSHMPRVGLKKNAIRARRAIVCDEARPELVPDVLKNVTGKRRERFIIECEHDVWFNSLGVSDVEELGEMVMERIVHSERVYDGDEPEDFSRGYYHPHTGDKHIGEDRAWCVVASS